MIRSRPDLDCLNPAHAAHLLSSNVLAGNWPERAPNTPFLPDIPVRKRLKTNDRLPREQHGMEEVVGSIPTRSTIFFSKASRKLTSAAGMVLSAILNHAEHKTDFEACSSDFLKNECQNRSGFLIGAVNVHTRAKPGDLR